MKPIERMSHVPRMLNVLRFFLEQYPEPASVADCHRHLNKMVSWNDHTPSAVELADQCAIYAGLGYLVKVVDPVESESVMKQVVKYRAPSVFLTVTVHDLQLRIAGIIERSQCFLPLVRAYVVGQAVCGYYKGALTRAAWLRYSKILENVSEDAWNAAIAESLAEKSHGKSLDQAVDMVFIESLILSGDPERR